MPFIYKTVLVVGATSGIGLALAERIIANGSHVIALGRRQENLDELIKKHGKDKVSSVKFDIADLSDIPGLAKSVINSHPKLDSVLLNAGIQRGVDFSKPESVNLDSIGMEFTINYLAYAHLTVAFLPHLQSLSLSGTPTSLIYTTSALALVPIPRCPNYCASKAALHHLILVLREQLKDGYPNLKVVEIVPPAVQTELHDQKHQPDIKDGGAFGMPLDEFTDHAWKGLLEEKEQIPVGMAEKVYAGFEEKRQGMFAQMVQMTKKKT